MITQEEAEHSAQVLIDTAKPLGMATARAVKADRMLKHIKALEMKKRNESALGAQEREAYASEAYKEALLEDATAAGELAALKAYREGHEAKIRMHQTEQATLRASRV